MSHSPIERRLLGSTGIAVSRVGVGTGTSGFTGVMAQAAMAPGDFADILAYGYEKYGINLWDTAHTYGTYAHLRAGLGAVARQGVVIIGKTGAATAKGALSEFEAALRGIGTDYLDVFMLHGVRGEREFRLKRGALEALVRLKAEGRVRAVGLSAHGLGGLRAALASPEIEAVLARMNYAGACMDGPQDGILSTLAGIPAVKEAAKRLIPKRLVPSLSGALEAECALEAHQEEALSLVRAMAQAGKGVLGMKLFGAGRLTADPGAAYAFARSRTEVDSFVIGMESVADLDAAATALGGS